MRTWDDLSRVDFDDGPVDPGSLVEACPSLACEVANFAIRGAVEIDQPGILRRVDNFFRGRVDSSNDGRFPSFEEAADQTVGRIVRDGSFNSNPSGYESVREDDVRQALNTRVRRFNRDLLPIGEPIYVLDSNEDLEYQRDAFNNAVAEQLRFPETRDEVMVNVGEWARTSNKRVRDQLQTGVAQLYDYVIRGGGISAANAALTLQETDPQGKILILDDGSEDGSEIGGQWAKYGNRPTFDMNSKIKAVQSVEDIYGLANPSRRFKLTRHACCCPPR